MPLDSGSAASQIDQPTGRAPQKAAKASVGLPLGAIAASRSQTAVSGSAPSFARQRPMPQRMSGACLAKISAPAPAREKPRALVTTQPLRGLAVADGDLLARLPEVELADLPGPVDGALVGAPGGKARADLAQVVVEDRLAALITELGEQLADAGAGDAVVRAQKALDLLLEGVELGGRLRPVVGRWALRRQGAADRFPVQTGAAADLPDRDAVDEVHPPDLRPVLHVDHLLLLASISSIGRASRPGRMAPALRQGGSVFDRRRWSSFQAAPTVVTRVLHRWS